MKVPAPSAVAAALVALALASGAGPAGAAPASAPGSAAGFAVINGSGSSWAALAIDQWAQDLRPRGLVLNFNPDGDAAGRGDYIAGQVDFAASDVAFRNGRDQLGGTGPEVVPWGYSYVPDVGGGIAFLYHLRVGGHLVRDLRLSARTLMEIFTGQITNWDNPQITRDNGRQLPSLKITPVVRADGAGPTFFFTRWMTDVFPRQWNAFCLRVRPMIKLPCGTTEFYPASGRGWRAKAEDGSNNVVTYITARGSNGAIGTRLPPNFSRAKGRSLSTFLDFALCRGQRQLAPLGYAPLPRNLVAGGLLEVRRIPGHVAVPSLSRCLGR